MLKCERLGISGLPFHVQNCFQDLKWMFSIVGITSIIFFTLCIHVEIHFVIFSLPASDSYLLWLFRDSDWLILVCSVPYFIAENRGQGKGLWFLH